MQISSQKTNSHKTYLLSYRIPVSHVPIQESVIPDSRKTQSPFKLNRSKWFASEPISNKKKESISTMPAKPVPAKPTCPHLDEEFFSFQLNHN
jgi:hypothetical protein